MAEAAHHAQVLPAGQVLVDGGVLPRQPDQAAHHARLPDDIAPEDLGYARVRLDDGREDPHRGRLSGPVGPEQPEHGSRLDVERDAVEGTHLALATEDLHQVARRDGDLARPADVALGKNSH